MLMLYQLDHFLKFINAGKHFRRKSYIFFKKSDKMFLCDSRFIRKFLIVHICGDCNKLID